MSVSDLPLLNACLNGLSTLFLIAGWRFIRNGRRQQHALMMGSAFFTSCVFLVFYVLHKILVKGVHTPIGAEGFWRGVYYFILITHIILAMVIVPMALMTIARARRGDFERHRRIARWTLPVWLYVSVTGVLVYLMLYRWFPSDPAAAAPPVAQAAAR